MNVTVHQFSAIRSRGNKSLLWSKQASVAMAEVQGVCSECFPPRMRLGICLDVDFADSPGG